MRPGSSRGAATSAADALGAWPAASVRLKPPGVAGEVSTVQREHVQFMASHLHASNDTTLSGWSVFTASVIAPPLAGGNWPANRRPTAWRVAAAATLLGIQDMRPGWQYLSKLRLNGWLSS
jgi:hypothetical protein